MFLSKLLRPADLLAECKLLVLCLLATILAPLSQKVPLRRFNASNRRAACEFHFFMQ